MQEELLDWQGLQFSCLCWGDLSLDEDLLDLMCSWRFEEKWYDSGCIEQVMVMMMVDKLVPKKLD